MKGGLRMPELKKEIEDMRECLNKAVENGDRSDILIISRKLDKLITLYYKCTLKPH